MQTKLTEPNKIYQYFLHFIGKGLYDKEDFIIESEKYGINRAFPPFMIKLMKFGDKILLAQYEPPKEEEQSKGIIFGYYAIDGLNFECENKEEFIKKLTSKLDIVSVSKESPKTVRRKCGSYTIGATYFVRDKLKDIIEKAETISKELGIKIKIFLGGSFNQLTLKEISPVKFTRTGTYIELDKKIEGEEIKHRRVGFIGNYEQRKYFLKEEKEETEVKNG